MPDCEKLSKALGGCFARRCEPPDCPCDFRMEAKQKGVTCPEIVAGYAYDALKKNDKAAWTSVKDRLPEERINPLTMDYQKVLCFCHFAQGRDIRVYGYGRGHFWHGPGEVDKYVTHWMPFPDPPDES